jgi:hypothetical protein
MRIVTGMHRSGTSLVARLLFEAGGDLGDPEVFHPADRWNPGGYYEQPAIHAVNMPLIHGRCGRLAYFWLPSARAILRRARKHSAQIRATARQYEGRFVKDPRFCLTLPAWQDHGATIEGIICCIRHPTAVAQSIRRRNHVPLSIGYSLWYAHNRRLLESADSGEMSIVCYENLLSAQHFAGEVSPVLRRFNIHPALHRLQTLYSRIANPLMNHCREVDKWKLPAHIDGLWCELNTLHGQQFRSSSNQAAVTRATASPAARTDEPVTAKHRAA